MKKTKPKTKPTSAGAEGLPGRTGPQVLDGQRGGVVAVGVVGVVVVQERRQPGVVGAGVGQRQVLDAVRAEQRQRRPVGVVAQPDVGRRRQQTLGDGAPQRPLQSFDQTLVGRRFRRRTAPLLRPQLVRRAALGHSGRAAADADADADADAAADATDAAAGAATAAAAAAAEVEAEVEATTDAAGAAVRRRIRRLRHRRRSIGAIPRLSREPTINVHRRSFFFFTLIDGCKTKPNKKQKRHAGRVLEKINDAEMMTDDRFFLYFVG